MKSRTTDEQIRLMEALKQCSYNLMTYEIVINENILKNRNTTEQIELMNKLKECNYNYNVFYFLINKKILQKKFEEQIKLIELLKECNFNNKIYELVTNENILILRTTDEQVKLIKILKQCDYNDMIYEIAINENILQKLNIREHISLIKEMKKGLNYDIFAIIEDIKSGDLKIEQSMNLCKYIKKDDEKIISDSHRNILSSINDFNELKKYILSLVEEYDKEKNISSDDIITYKKIK